MAMIMDGNTRWSKKNNVDIKQGYTRGLKNIKNVINVCLDKNIKNLTLYALSSENIKRSSVRIIFNILVYSNQSMIKAKKGKDQATELERASIVKVLY